MRRTAKNQKAASAAVQAARFKPDDRATSRPPGRPVSWASLRISTAAGIEELTAHRDAQEQDGPGLCRSETGGPEQRNQDRTEDRRRPRLAHDRGVDQIAGSDPSRDQQDPDPSQRLHQELNEVLVALRHAEHEGESHGRADGHYRREDWPSRRPS